MGAIMHLFAWSSLIGRVISLVFNKTNSGIDIARYFPWQIQEKQPAGPNSKPMLKCAALRRGGEAS
jgi:hypothetical protein